MSFSDAVEVIKGLSFDEKQEIHLLLEQYLREERRDEIYKNYQKSRVAQERGELSFSSDINELMTSLEENDES